MKTHKSCKINFKLGTVFCVLQTRKVFAGNISACIETYWEVEYGRSPNMKRICRWKWKDVYRQYRKWREVEE